ncbi:MAG: phosphoenolpyruvate--protein phosphotransferase [Eubacteriales bacterium]
MRIGEILEGISVSTGVGIGEIHVINSMKLEISQSKFSTFQEEVKRLAKGIDIFCNQTYGMFQKIRDLLGQEDALILGGQIFMARDLEFVEELHEEIRQNNTAEEAVFSVFEKYLSYFRTMEDELMSQRGEDLLDMRDTIIEILQGQQQNISFPKEKAVVLCVTELTPSLMSMVSEEKIAGILCEKGGLTSHCAILARATGIPAIFSVDCLFDHVAQGDLFVVDGSAGRAIRNPQPTVLEKYHEKSKHFNKERGELESFRRLGTQTAKGEKLSLLANIGDFGQIYTALDLGADGVGLFRTEYLFMDSQHLPTEEQQFRVYSRMGKMMAPKPVSIRTLDIGGDKVAPCIPLEPEENPFLGQRALRLCLSRLDIFQTQIRAILRASAVCPNITLLLPFVIEMDELQAVAEFVRDCRGKLKEEGVPVADDVPLGVVIETPSAAVLVDLICDYVDYISIGTNDLTQYLTVADRGNLRVAEHYNPFNLSVLRTLKNVISCCNEKKVPITLCGEVVADPRMVPLLLGFGNVNFSVSPSEILSLRRELSFWTPEEAKAITEIVMKLRTSSEIEAYLNEAILDKEERIRLFREKVEQVATR